MGPAAASLLRRVVTPPRRGKLERLLKRFVVREVALDEA
jgi:hypothetical protein